jgi:hypothetical protein
MFLTKKKTLGRFHPKPHSHQPSLSTKFICRTVSLCSSAAASRLGSSLNSPPPSQQLYWMWLARGCSTPKTDPSTNIADTWRKRPVAKDHHKDSPPLLLASSFLTIHHPLPIFIPSSLFIPRKEQKSPIKMRALASTPSPLFLCWALWYQSLTKLWTTSCSRFQLQRLDCYSFPHLLFRTQQ